MRSAAPEVSGAPDASRIATALLLSVVVASWGSASALADAPSLTMSSSGPRWLSIGLLGGSAQPDGHLADYQWDVSPRLAWGLEALAGGNGWASGFRFSRTVSTQDMGTGADPDVRLTSWELVSQLRVVTIGSVGVLATAGAGLLHLGYHPDRITVTPGSGTPIVVELEPVNTWVAGGGLGLERPLWEAWHAALEVEHRIFELDTAHRNGDAIETRHERFGDWSARLELGRRWECLAKGSSR